MRNGMSGWPGTEPAHAARASPQARRVFLRGDRLEMNKAATGIQSNTDHARYGHRGIECGHFACPAGGKKSLRAHLARTLPVPEIHGRWTVIVQRIPTR